MWKYINNGILLLFKDSLNSKYLHKIAQFFIKNMLNFRNGTEKEISFILNMSSP